MDAKEHKYHANAQSKHMVITWLFFNVYKVAAQFCPSSNKRTLAADNSLLDEDYEATLMGSSQNKSKKIKDSN